MVTSCLNATLCHVLTRRMKGIGLKTKKNSRRSPYCSVFAFDFIDKLVCCMIGKTMQIKITIQIIFVRLVRILCFIQVAFVLVSLINDKTTILLRSVRIRKSHSGHGIVKSLILWIIQHYKKRKVKVCWICFEDSSPYALEYIEKGIFQVITCRVCFSLIQNFLSRTVNKVQGGEVIASHSPRCV